MTTPLSEVSAGILVAPLVGAWNDERIKRFEYYLMTTIERHSVRAVVFDMQVIVASERLGHMLDQMLRTLVLLGCRGVLVGIQPETAQILMNLAMDWHDVAVAGTLADGVRLAERLVATATLR